MKAANPITRFQTAAGLTAPCAPTGHASAVPPDLRMVAVNGSAGISAPANSVALIALED